MSTPDDGASGAARPETPSAPVPADVPSDPVRRERMLLADAMAQTGPDAPTECEGWTVRDLAAHLVVREGRPDTGPGILLPPLAFYTESVRRRVARNVPFEGLMERFRSGPPKFSPFALPGVDKNANGVEFFVHHEDVRRAAPDWEPRELQPALEELLWRRIRIARFVLRKVHVEVTLVQPDGRSARVSGGPKRTGRGGPSGGVRVHGPVGELVLWVAGRTDVARVRVTGPTDSVKTLTEAGWSL